MDDAATQCEPTSTVDVPTQAAAELAWSDESTTTAQPEPSTWRSACTRATLIALCGVAAAASIYLLARPPATHAPPPQPTISAQPPAPTVPPAPITTAAPPPPTVVAEPPTIPPPIDPLTPNDHRFLAQLDNDGIPQRKPGTEGSAIATAEAICRAFNQGDSFQHLRSVMTQQYLTSAQATAYIQDAVAFYCPHAMY
jgi:hypothetical protein